MFTAKVKSKSLEFGVLTVYVEFTDGASTVVEWVKPQDADGFKYWVKSRLEQFNNGPVLDTALPIDSVIDVSDPVVPALTAQEIAKKEWLLNYYLWTKVKTTLIDTSILTGSETKVLALQNKVKADFLPAYLDFI